MPDTTTQTRDVPADALRFDCESPLQFAEMQEGGSNERVAFEMLARSPQPISHWYWGRIVHDMAGMFTRKPTLPIDYCHRGQWSIADLIGMASEFDADEQNGLTIRGQLVSTRGDDVARDVIDKGQAGIPFESSIDFYGPGLVLEEVGEGASVEVNGYTFEGPGVVARKWPLRGAAVCPYGADSNARAAFAERDQESGDETVAVQFLFSEGKPDMTKPNTQPETGTETELSADDIRDAAAADARKSLSAEIKRFTDQFGAENGLKWHDEGKTFEEALIEQNKILSAGITERDGTVAELNERITSLSTGESPIDTDPAAGGDGKKSFKDVFRMPSSLKQAG